MCSPVNQQNATRPDIGSLTDLHYCEQPLNVNTGTIRPNRCLPLWQHPNPHLRPSRGSGTVYAKYVCPISHSPIPLKKHTLNLQAGEDLVLILPPCCPQMWCVLGSGYLQCTKRWMIPLPPLINSAFDTIFRKRTTLLIVIWARGRALSGGVCIRHTHTAEHISLPRLKRLRGLKMTVYQKTHYLLGRECKKKNKSSLVLSVMTKQRGGGGEEEGWL